MLNQPKTALATATDREHARTPPRSCARAPAPAASRARARAARRACRSASSRASRSRRRSRLAFTTPQSTSWVSSTRRTSSRSSMRSSRRSTSFASVPGGAPAAAKSLVSALLGEALAVARFGEQVVLDHLAHARRLVGERALVELGEDGVARAGEQVGGNLGAALRDARVVELAADERQQRRLDLGVGSSEPPAMKRTIAAATSSDTSLPPGFITACERLRAGHPREPHPVLRDRGHQALQRLRGGRGSPRAARSGCGSRRARSRTARRSHSSCSIRASSAFGARFSTRSARSSRNCAARCAPEVVALREREDLLELVEDQQRDQRLARRVAQDVVAVVQELPQRLAADGDAGLRPCAGRLRLRGRSPA